MVYRTIGLASLALLIPALYWTIRLDCADWLFVKGDAASLRLAIRLAPGTTEYYSALAQSEPEHAAVILKEAAALNPRSGSLRVELGLAEEDAEGDLLEATKLDTGFAPRWALSDFYFQRHDTEKFWPAVKSALAVSYGDITPQLRECWTLRADAQTILDRAIPDRPEVWRRYLDFLLADGRLDAAAPVAAKVLATADKQSVPSLLSFCDRMLTEWRGADALVVWNGLAQRKLAGVEGHGFDRRIATPAGTYAERAPAGLILTFSGKQSEDVELVSQYVPLQPRRRYVFTVRYRVSGIGVESGLICHLQLAGGRDLLAGHGVLPGAAGTLTQTFPFEAPDGATVGRAVLQYRRMPGTTRIEGAFTLQEFAVAPGDDR